MGKWEAEDGNHGDCNQSTDSLSWSCKQGFIRDFSVEGGVTTLCTGGIVPPVQSVEAKHLGCSRAVA